MKKNEKIFLQKNDLLPELKFYMIFVEAIHPILFVCTDSDSNLYICSCHCSNATKCEWLIAQTSCDKLLALLTDKIAIRDAFVNDDSKLYIATLLEGMQSPNVLYKDVSEIDPDAFPTAGYYMEVEGDEFQNEISTLSEIAKTTEKNSVQQSFYSVFMNFSPFCISASNLWPDIALDSLLSDDKTYRCYSV